MRSPAAGTQTIVRAGSFDAASALELQSVFCQGHILYLTGSADPLPFPGAVGMNGSGVDAMTLATPLAGDQPSGDDGKEILVIDLVGQAHTITTASNKIINSKHIATFNGTIGSYIRMIAFNGLWIPVALGGVTIS